MKKVILAAVVASTLILPVASSSIALAAKSATSKSTTRVQKDAPKVATPKLDKAKKTIKKKAHAVRKRMRRSIAARA